MQDWGGPLGAAIGFGLGLLEYRLIAGVVVAALRRTDRSQTEAERADYARRIRILQRVLLVMTAGSMSAIGFFVGRLLAG